MQLDWIISFPDKPLKNLFQNVPVILYHCSLKTGSLLESLEIILLDVAIRVSAGHLVILLPCLGDLGLPWAFGGGVSERYPLMGIGPVGPDLEKDSYCGQHSRAAEGQISS